MCQFAPLDLPAAVDAFLSYWKPNVVFLMESELWPNIVMATSESKVSQHYIVHNYAEMFVINKYCHIGVAHFRFTDVTCKVICCLL